VRSDRVLAKSDSGPWLTAIEVRWNSPHERAQFEAFLWAIPRSPRQGWHGRTVPFYPLRIAPSEPDDLADVRTDGRHPAPATWLL